MLNHFKFYNALFNGMALLLMAAGMIAGPILENSTLVACLAAVGTVVKGWNDFKKYSFKVDMSRFAFTTYAKALIELRTYVRGIPFDGLEGFLNKMQTLDDTIIDFTPPLPKRCVQEYYRHFVYQQVDANRFKRQELLQHANADQINAVSELVLNLLKNTISVTPPINRDKADLLADPQLPPAIVNAKTKRLSQELIKLTKRIRQFPGGAGIGAPGGPPGEEEKKGIW